MKWFLFFLIAGISLVLANWNFSIAEQKKDESPDHPHFHQFDFTQGGELDPIFLHSRQCDGCHSYDPAGIASVDSMGNDINLFDDWQASMLGLSAVDPYWRAKVRHETYLFPEKKNEIEGTCLKCHAPMGHYNASFSNQSYTMNDLFKDSLGLDGVSCMTCHSISNRNLGNSFNGEIEFDTSRVAYGPYPFPFEGPMTSFVGVKPLYSFHVFDSGMCADCHTLITESIDSFGNFTGQKFIEQATYHEWLNSSYAVNQVTCQECHMEQVLEPIVVSSNINGLEPRSFFRKHGFAGANVQMLTAIRNNKEFLNITIPDSLFDESIDRSKRNVQEYSVKMAVEQVEVINDKLTIEFSLTNKTGHKFPTGYPIRRAYLEFIVTSTNGDTLFHSGRRNGNRLSLSGESFHEHYDTISNQEQLQIYQIVNEDVYGNITSSLNAAHRSIKDNRLPPKGFRTDHAVYDTTQIVGEAYFDQNFNLDNQGIEGTGADHIFYQYDLREYNENFINIDCKLWYESIPFTALVDIFNSDLPEADTLAQVLDGQYSPVLVDRLDIDSILLQTHQEERNIEDPTIVAPYPNPGRHSFEIRFIEVISQIDKSNIHVYDMNGQRQEVQFDKLDDNRIIIHLTNSISGVYFIDIETSEKLYAFKWVKQ